MGKQFGVMFDDKAYRDEAFRTTVHIMASLLGVTLLREGVVDIEIGESDQQLTTKRVTVFECKAMSFPRWLFTKCWKLKHKADGRFPMYY